MADPIHYIPITAPPLASFGERGPLVLAPRYAHLGEPFRSALLALAGDVNGRWCFNCRTPIGYTEVEGAVLSRAWWPAALLSSNDYPDVTVTCQPCADPFPSLPSLELS